MRVEIVDDLIAGVPMPAGAERRGPYLVAPDRVGDWTLAAWDGSRWYDLASGDLLSPLIWTALPVLHFARPVLNLVLDVAAG